MEEAHKVGQDIVESHILSSLGIKEVFWKRGRSGGSFWIGHAKISSILAQMEKEVAVFKRQYC